MNKILVVDDDYAIRFLYEEELNIEGYDVITEKSCEGLMERIGQENPDLVVLDVIVGRKNTLDVLQTIRNRHYDLPVILCSAYEGFKYDPKSIAADYYVIKSSDLMDLKTKIKMAFEGRRAFLRTGSDRDFETLQPLLPVGSESNPDSPTWSDYRSTQ
jgi:DNA-binding NtrC family response regulator